MSQTEELLQLSIIYRTLIDDLEAIVSDEWSATEKHRMIECINGAVGQALNHYTLRCKECDETIDPICDECNSQQELRIP